MLQMSLWEEYYELTEIPLKGTNCILDFTWKIGGFNVYHKQNWTMVKHPELYTSHIFVTSILVMWLTGYLLLGIHASLSNQLNYNNTLKFVPTMEVSGNEKAKNVKYLTYMTFNQTTHHSINQMRFKKGII